MLATPTPTDLEPRMCLLHGDFHPMGQDCWATTLDFYLVHEDLGQQASRDAYLAAVERKMLDGLLPQRRPAAGSH